MDELSVSITRSPELTVKVEETVEDVSLFLFLSLSII